MTLKKYNILQVNFNAYHNPNGHIINRYYMIDVDDISNVLTNNICILNIDIENAYKLCYDKSIKREITLLERLAGLLNCDDLKSISEILGDDLFTMEEKKKIVDSIKEISNDEEVQEALKLENDIEYRFKLTSEDAYKKYENKNFKNFYFHSGSLNQRLPFLVPTCYYCIKELK